jgi:ribosomal protein S30
LKSGKSKNQEPRCQDPKKEYKIKPRIKERIQKEINLKGPVK